MTCIKLSCRHGVQYVIHIVVIAQVRSVLWNSARQELSLGAARVQPSPAGHLFHPAALPFARLYKLVPVNVQHSEGWERGWERSGRIAMIGYGIPTCRPSSPRVDEGAPEHMAH